MTGCFHSSLKGSAIKRAETSQGPPGPNPTTILTVLFGKTCASARMKTLAGTYTRAKEDREMMGRAKARQALSDAARNRLSRREGLALDEDEAMRLLSAAV